MQDQMQASGAAGDAPTAVLVVDDDRSIAEVVRQALMDEGYSVTTASDGIEALERVETDTPALVVLDLMMPRLDGFGFLDRLHETKNGSGPSVIVLSARSGPDDIAQAIEKGASDFLTKPFDLEELLLRVRLHLARRTGTHVPISDGAPQGVLEIRCFGGLRLTLDGRQLFDENWRNRTAKRLFKYLYTHRGQRLSKEAIVAMMWPGSEPAAALNNLRVNVHVLRQTLTAAARDAGVSLTSGATASSGGSEEASGVSDPQGPELGSLLLRQQQGFYYFNTDAPCWSDVDAFNEHVKAGRASQSRGDVDATIRAYDRAVGMYRGPYLPEDVLDDVLTRERERLRDDFFVVAGELMKFRAERGEYEEAIQTGRLILREDSARESAYRGLMRYLALLGRRDEAIQVYHRACEALNTELGVEPAPETRDLYDRIRSSGLPEIRAIA